MGRWLIRLAVLAALGLIAVGLVLTVSRIGDFDLPQAAQRPVTFTHGDHRLDGTLITASEAGGVVLLVHGDGPQDRWADGGYLPLVNTLLDAGISVFSWDKPGVGASTGNWLDQSMPDRAGETAAALAALRQLPGMEDRPIGLLGFSQAGWVLPRVPTLTDEASFLVLMGGAINWQAQGRYAAIRRMQNDGQPPAAIEAELARQAVENRDWFEGSRTYEAYLAAQRAAGRAEARILSEDRFRFVRKNAQEDARAPIAELTLTVLVISGEEDLNADARDTVSVYRSLLNGVHPRSQFHLVPNATHALLSADRYNYQLPGQWPRTAQARFILSGRNAYEGDVLEIVTGWINDVAGRAP
ncbi:alpha/beta hydrolase family protein [Tritonibacter horizontis]|uniref:Alpha/beta hydrolase family protein n=1 Tax=Tritonibacter horizontis TaxID=1768241 RepID=A0A132BY34_9RHOB|nr:alpha/beta fold hydrolase [Tritonibacter horizontis]KUP93204.1 alpha/beta hydrolase family protein [Tritonibacter horizontis]